MALILAIEQFLQLDLNSRGQVELSQVIDSVPRYGPMGPCYGTSGHSDSWFNLFSASWVWDRVWVPLPPVGVLE